MTGQFSLYRRISKPKWVSEFFLNHVYANTVLLFITLLSQSGYILLFPIFWSSVNAFCDSLSTFSYMSTRYPCGLLVKASALGAGVCLFVGCLTSQQQDSVSQGRICTDNLTCCHTEIEVAGPTFYLTQSQYTDTGPTSPSADPIMSGAWQGSHWSAKF